MSGLPTMPRVSWVWLWPVLCGCLVALLPHIAQRAAFGNWFFPGSYDDHYYSMVARIPLFGGWTLHDPLANTSEGIRSSYAWGLFVPMAKLIGFLGGDASLFLLGWRAFGGALLGGGLWLLLLTLFQRCGAAVTSLAGRRGVAALAAVTAASLTVDPGLDYASLPIERALVTVTKLLRHAPPLKTPGWYAQFRVVSPLCGLGVLCFFLALLCRPKLTQSFAIGAGLLLGVLFNLYFFYWTAAVSLLLVLLVIQCLPARVRRWFALHQPPRLLLLTLALGFAFGLPQLLGDLSSFGDPVIREALDRSPRGLALSWHNPERWVFLTGPRLWLGCALVCLAAYRVRALCVPALVVLISFALGNSAVVTSLQFENYKWFLAFQTVSYVSIWVWVVVEGARFMRARYPSALPFARCGLVGVMGALLALAVVWIPRECLSAPEAVARGRRQGELRGIEPLVAKFAKDASVALPVEASSVMLFTSCGVLYAPAHSRFSFISDKELIKRQVLSAWVLGEDRSRLDLRSDLAATMFGETRPRWQHLREDYERAVRETRATALDDFRVRYAVNRCAQPPSAETGNWRKLGEADLWCAWERTPSRY